MNSPSSIAVQIKDVNHTYISRKKSRQVLTNVSLNVQTGEIFGLLGPNGGGKTTLFKILSTALPLTNGSIQIFGIDVKTDPTEIRKKIGVVFQNPSLDKKLTLLENILTQGSLYGLRGTDLKNRAQTVLKKLSIEDRASDFVEHLSGGLQRRGEIAKGLLHRPELLLMDEPSTGLDPGARHEMWDLLLELKKEGVTIMVTTHLMEEGDKCDHLAILHQGRCVAMGTPNELKKKIGGDMVIVQTEHAPALSEKIKNMFGVQPTVLENTVRIEIPEGHKFIPKLVESFPGLIKAVSVGKPTLEDVFVQETGSRFGEDHV